MTSGPRGRLATLGTLRDDAAGCRECPLGARATQTVWGEGQACAPLILREEAEIRQSCRVRIELSSARASDAPPASRRSSRIAAHSAPAGSNRSGKSPIAHCVCSVFSANCANVKT